ncbi:hypothetical protein [Massilia sp. CCM 8734]|uniref:hypothetical protein n=1 Tax=Massilia sp. CCM 8734 TaxID=2609283 RepID=UPI0014229358|nr:hypothetical protein [Massilia sp. CCM 8734]NHZ94891.1 hypothetical protein [Massilia sp. CCM 8734]
MSRVMYLFVFVFSVTYLNAAEAKQKMRKFTNPTAQFVGTWRVEAHDFREFFAGPDNLAIQLENQAASFPVGQKLKIESTGAAVMPGTYNTEKNRFEGPVGETLLFTFMSPLEENLCKGYWNSVCGGGVSETEKDFMIVEIYRWHADDIKLAKMWPEVKHVTYSLVSLNKQHSFKVWMTKSGKLILPIFLEGKSKEGKPFGDMGVILKRIEARKE